MFTRQHYKAIAEIVKDCHHYDSCGQTMSDVCFHRLQKRLADYFAQDNMQFDRQKFLEACGLNT